MTAAIIGMAVVNICIILYCAALRKELTDAEDMVKSFMETQCQLNGTVAETFKEQQKVTDGLLNMVEQINGRR